MVSIKSSVLCGLLSAQFAIAAGPFFTRLSSTSYVIGNDLWNITVGSTHGKKLYYKGADLIGAAEGVYFSYNGTATLTWTSASIYSQTADALDVVFKGDLGDFHWVIQPNLAGAYQYFVNTALPALVEFRTLSRLDNSSFTRGQNSKTDVDLPTFSTILKATNVQDETWQLANGSYITKYNFATFVRDEAAYGVYGPKFGCWYIAPGKDDYNGDQLKQELTFHRESSTGDTVLLNMLHGTHFQLSTADTFAVGKIWGPWLWYLNNGSASDAASRYKDEYSAYPYKWFNNSAYQSRGSVSGALQLSDGRHASGAAVSLGDNNSASSSLDQGKGYYYTAYADANGNFKFDNVRSGSYALQAWSNGAPIGDVSTTYLQNNVAVTKGAETKLSQLTWKTQGRKVIWQIGDMDRKALGFKFGGVPRQHALVDQCPINLTVAPGPAGVSQWCYSQSAIGSWTVAFDLTAQDPVTSAAVLSVSLAGYSAGTSSSVLVNGVVVGSLKSGASKLGNDPSVYRSGNLAGEWRYFEFPVATGGLKAGHNEVTFKVTTSSKWRGFIWDSVMLEWK